MDSEWSIKYLRPKEPLRSQSASIESRVNKLETLQKISSDLQDLNKRQENLTNSRTDQRIVDLETRVGKIEESDMQKLIDIAHNSELHEILLEQTEDIRSLKTDIEEISYNISNDDRISTMLSEWQERLYSMCDSLEKIGKSLDRIDVTPLNKEVQKLLREVIEDNIRKEQEAVRIDLIEEQIGEIRSRCKEVMPVSQEIEMEQELFLQSLKNQRY